MRALLVAACLATTAALYADQAGEQDWHRENIGRVTHAASKQKALFVLTEAGDRSLVASLGARTGNLNWRTALPPNEKGHAIALTDKAVVTLSGEGKCRAWAQAGGALLWEQPALPGVSAQALAVIEANKQCTVAVLAGNGVAFWDCSTGAARGAWFAERDEDVSFAGVSNDDVRARTNDDHRSSDHASPSPARESAWRLTAHAPVTLRTALPCDCAYALRYENGRVASEGVLVAGVAERVTRADPRASLSLELVPIVADAGDAAWTCASPAPMPAPPALGRGGVRRHPSAERDAECRVSIVGGRKYEHLFDAENDDASRAALTTALTPSATKPAVSTVRLAVTCERVCATRVGSAPAPLTVDIRAPTAVANGCAFAMVCGAAPPSAGSALVSVGAGSQTLAPGESDETIASRRREHPRTKGGDVDGIAPPDLRRVVWIAPADDATLATLGSAAFRRVEATAGAPPTRIALAFAAPKKRFRTDKKGEKEDAREKEEEGDASFAVEVAAVARAWAPRGVSAASPRPCVRVALVPTLSATNLSDRTLRVRFRDDWETTEARRAGAAPRAFSVDVANRCSEPRTTLAPGAGPVAVRRSAAALASAIERRRAREERGARRNRGGGEDSEDSRADAARAEDADDLGDDSGRGAEELRDALEIFGGGGDDDDEGGDEGEKGAVVSVAAALAAGPRGLEVELADGARVLVAVEPVGPEGCRSTCRAVTFRGCASSPTARAPNSPGPRIETTPRDETMPRGDRAPPAAPFALEVALPSASASLVDGADELALASFERATVAWRRNLAGVGGERKKRPSGKDSGDESDAEAFDPFPHGVVSALEVSLGAFQLDDQTPRSAFPVVVWHNPALGPTLRATLTAAEGFETLEKNVFSSGVVADRHRTVPSFHPAMCASLAPGGVHARVPDQGGRQRSAEEAAIVDDQGEVWSRCKQRCSPLIVLLVMCAHERRRTQRLLFRQSTQIGGGQCALEPPLAACRAAVEC